MSKYWAFFKYLMCHKWHVFWECCQMGVPWQGITHDISKFRPGEFAAYADYYYANHICSRRTGEMIEADNSAYHIAWLIHQKRNRHHWQWWILHGDDNVVKPLPMAEKYVKEMVADWRGAGKAQGEPNIIAWYHRHKGKMILHPSTRIRVEQLLYAEISLAAESDSQARSIGRAFNRNLQHKDGIEAKGTS